MKESPGILTLIRLRLIGHSDSSPFREGTTETIKETLLHDYPKLTTSFLSKWAPYLVIGSPVGTNTLPGLCTREFQECKRKIKFFPVFCEAGNLAILPDSPFASGPQGNAGQGNSSTFAPQFSRVPNAKPVPIIPRLEVTAFS